MLKQILLNLKDFEKQTRSNKKQKTDKKLRRQTLNSNEQNYFTDMKMKNQ